MQRLQTVTTTRVKRVARGMRMQSDGGSRPVPGGSHRWITQQQQRQQQQHQQQQAAALPPPTLSYHVLQWLLLQLLLLLEQGPLLLLLEQGSLLLLPLLLLLLLRQRLSRGPITNSSSHSSSRLMTRMIQWKLCMMWTRTI